MESLLKSYDTVRSEGRIYISPGAYGGIYQVNERYQDVKYFSKWVVRQLHMYEKEKFLKQYLAVQPFFSPELLVTADNHYRGVASAADGKESYVSIDHAQIEVDEVPAKERHRRGEKDYFVIVYATVHEFGRMGVSDPLPLQITIRLKSVSITNSNPYGFVILNYTEKEKAKIERAA
ncbi:MAG: hypothetical protein VX730_04515 [Pseudomonadota bacterium]|nr:hypothetical protein [Pseudomonadota bacterium]